MCNCQPAPNPVAECEKNPLCHWVDGQCLCTGDLDTEKEKCEAIHSAIGSMASATAGEKTLSLCQDRFPIPIQNQSPVLSIPHQIR